MRYVGSGCVSSRGASRPRFRSEAKAGGTRNVRIASSLSYRPRQDRPGQQELRKLREMLSAAGGIRARILHAHFASLGAADVVFEQEAPDVAALEQQISKLTSSADFQTWSGPMSALLIQSPKREVYILAD